MLALIPCGIHLCASKPKKGDPFNSRPDVFIHVQANTQKGDPFNARPNFLWYPFVCKQA
jgi:hypothetical protein